MAVMSENAYLSMLEIRRTSFHRKDTQSPEHFSVEVQSVYFISSPSQHLALADDSTT
jgi:hypothetical protein